MIPDVLIIESAKGNVTAFEELYRHTSPFVYSVIYRILERKEDSEDVTQETFIKVFQYLPKFRFQSSFKTWIYRIAVNCALTKLKKRINKEGKTSPYEDTILHQTPDTSDRGAIENQELEDQIHTMLKPLNPEQRTCIILREIEGLSYQEMADTLKMNINTIRTRLKRARDILIKTYRPERRIEK
ncbi:MAG: RNA polymerase sigma factor [Chlamydiota bacterium]|nr:RNA polymerase sigma factor [Chlamydiota bacterium]